MSKEIISDYAYRLGSVALDIVKQLNGSKVTLKERFYISMLGRQGILLQDIGETLSSRQLNAQMSTFILFRCLLDDFITLLYFESKNFDEAYLIDHTAKAYREKYKWLKESRDLNIRYFNEELTDMATTELYERELNEFCNNPANHIYFKNPSKREWKSFPSTSDIVRQLPVNGVAKANAHALILWKHLSVYVHYSAYTADLEKPNGARETEIEQLKEALFYVYKTIIMCSGVLTHYGLKHSLNDPSKIRDELLKDGVPMDPVEEHVVPTVKKQP